MCPATQNVFKHPPVPTTRCCTYLNRPSTRVQRAVALKDSGHERHGAAPTTTHAQQDAAASTACSRSHLLRSVVVSAAALGAISSFGSAAAAGSPLAAGRSLDYSQPATLTIRNEGKHPLKVYWLNYDGDQELFTYLEPATSWTVDTFSTHPWRIVDEETGMVLKELVATPGDQTVRMTGEEKPLPQRQTAVEFQGFDGIGGRQGDYSEAEVATLFVSYEGGAVGLKVEGAKYPVEIPLPSSQMVGLVESASGELRRPSSMMSWQRTLQAAGAKVQRVVVTRVVPPYFYTRVVLQLPGGKTASIDTQPGDGIALAQQTGCPVYIANDIVSLVNDLMDQRAAQSVDVLGSLVPGAPVRQLPSLPKAPTAPPTLPGITNGAPPPAKTLPPAKGYAGTPYAMLGGQPQAAGLLQM